MASTTTPIPTRGSSAFLGSCRINGADNWFYWLMEGLFFVACVASFFFIMTKQIGLKFTMGKKCKIYALITNSLALASILTSVILTIIVVASYDRCNTLQAQYFLTWIFQDIWESDSVFGLAVWGIGVLFAICIYIYLLRTKFYDGLLEQTVKEEMIEKGEDPDPKQTLQQQISAQFRFYDSTADDIVLGKQMNRGCKWIYKLIFFVVNFSFCAVIRPYYQIGVHPDGYPCACVEPNIGLITEIYASALIALIIGPCAWKCSGGEERCGEGQVLRCCSYTWWIVAWICFCIIIASPAILIGFRLSSFFEQIFDDVVPDDFNLFIWFFDAISNLN